jgi:hypothetical protein
MIAISTWHTPRFIADVVPAGPHSSACITGNRNFDLIMNVGSHPFEPSRTFFEDTYAHLADEDLYIVEGVMRGDLPV